MRAKKCLKRKRKTRLPDWIGVRPSWDFLPLSVRQRKKSWRNRPTEKEFYLTEYLVLNDEEIEELNREEKEYRMSIKSI